jgi:hypothetical protein
MKKIVVPLFAVVIGVAGAFAAFNLLNHFEAGHAPLVQLVPVGEVSELSGEVTHRLPRSINIEPIKEPGLLHSQELLTTGHASFARLKLDEGSELRLEEDSSVVVEIDPTKENSLTVTLLAGRLSPLRTGKPGALRLFREGREIPLSGDAESTLKPSVPVIGRSDDSATGFGASTGDSSGGVVVAPTPDETLLPPTSPPQKATTQGKPAKASSSSAQAGTKVTDTLSDDEVRKYLRAQNGFFQRCYLTYMNRAGRVKSQQQPNAPEKRGTVTVAFTIEPSGKTSGAAVVRSDFKDPTLQKCIIEVIDRTPFRAFDGDPIDIAEFPIAME